MMIPSDIWLNVPLTDFKFTQFALEVYRFQCIHNKVYAQWLHLLGRTDQNIEKIEDIPFLPISLFKTHEVRSFPSHEITFVSSATTGSQQSQHHIHKASDYIDTFTRGFRDYFKGRRFDYLAALLPSYLDRSGSGLIYMVEHLMAHEIGQGDFYNRDFLRLVEDLERLSSSGKRVLLFGVTFGLLALTEIPNKIDWNYIEIVETGGMKGHGKELTRGEVTEQLVKAFPGVTLHSEYGMTELSSQAYGTSGGNFECPSWMRVCIQDPADPQHLLPQGKTGRICIIDLMNYHSCAFIATDDLGRMDENGNFEVLGRLDYADVRGCNQLL